METTFEMKIFMNFDRFQEENLGTLILHVYRLPSPSSPKLFHNVRPIKCRLYHSNKLWLVIVGTWHPTFL